MNVIPITQLREEREARQPSTLQGVHTVIDRLCEHLDADPLVQAPGLQVLYCMQQRMESKKFARECVAWLRMYELRAGMAATHGHGQVAL